MKFKSIFFGVSAFLMAATTLMAQSPPKARDVVAEIKAAHPNSKSGYVDGNLTYQVIRKGTIELRPNVVKPEIKAASVANPNANKDTVTVKPGPAKKVYWAEPRGPKPDINKIMRGGKVFEDTPVLCTLGENIDIKSPLNGSTHNTTLMNQDVPFEFDYIINCTAGAGTSCGFCIGYELYLGTSKISSAFWTQTVACNSNATFTISGTKALTPGNYHYKCMILTDCNNPNGVPIVTENSYFTVTMTP